MIAYFCLISRTQRQQRQQHLSFDLADFVLWPFAFAQIHDKNLLKRHYHPLFFGSFIQRCLQNAWMEEKRRKIQFISLEAM